MDGKTHTSVGKESEGCRETLAAVSGGTEGVAGKAPGVGGYKRLKGTEGATSRNTPEKDQPCRRGGVQTAE